uniref:Uncharacterized protein n=1 Tax=Lepeophtheirus salmonis TaxID=72036 RepID=A0A0K2TK45_LEPSM
MTYLLVKLFYS